MILILPNRRRFILSCPHALMLKIAILLLCKNLCRKENWNCCDSIIMLWFSRIFNVGLNQEVCTQRQQLAYGNEPSCSATVFQWCSEFRSVTGWFSAQPYVDCLTVILVCMRKEIKNFVEFSTGGKNHGNFFVSCNLGKLDFLSCPGTIPKEGKFASASFQSWTSCM